MLFAQAPDSQQLSGVRPALDIKEGGAGEEEQGWGRRSRGGGGARILIRTCDARTLEEQSIPGVLVLGSVPRSPWQQLAISLSKHLKMSSL